MGKMNKGFDSEGEISSKSDNWGGVHLELRFRGSHNHDGKEFENRPANNAMNEKTLKTYVTTNTEIRHFRIAL